MVLDKETLDLVWKLAAIIFGAGVVWGQLKAIRKDIARLERKQEESNNVKTRTAAVEAVQKMQQQELIELKKVVYGNNRNLYK